MPRNHTVFICLLLLSSLSMCKCWWTYYQSEYNKHWTLSGGFPTRIYSLMKEHYEDIARKIEFIHNIRFTYEVSAEYETGYLMGELVERYRKMVEHLKRPVMYVSDAVFDTIKRLELIEMLYFEIYHLVNMMHEIPNKYGVVPNITKPETATDNRIPFDNNQQGIQAFDRLEKDKRDREKKKKEKLKDMKKWKELIQKGHYHTTRSRRPQNKYWPIDYGWEIDYYW